MRGLLSMCFLIAISSAFTFFKTQVVSTAFTTTSKDNSNLIALTNETKDPIYVKDGKKISKKEMESIAPEYIASVEVWKDEEAIKKYGKKAQDGVVLIYTKEYAGRRKIENEEDLNKVFMDEPVDPSTKNDFPNTENNTADLESSNQINGKVLETKNPLYILNGKPLEISETGKVPAEIASLDPASIDQINVLKDQEAIKAYGKKGIDGVIIIITKDFKEAEEKP